MYYFTGVDINASPFFVIFDAFKSGCCINVTAFRDTFIEPSEIFNAIITVNAPAVSSGDAIPVTVEDNNGGEVIISFAEPAYSVPEGDSVAVCFLVTSEVSNIQRDVMVSVFTIEADAQGKLV